MQTQMQRTSVKSDLNFEKLRREAEEQVLSLSQNLPTRKNEDYRYFSLTDLDWNRSSKETSQRKEIAQSLLDSKDQVLVFQEAAASEISCKASLKNAFAGSLKEALTRFPELFEKHPELLGTPSLLKTDLFAQLTVSRALDGVFVYVPQGVRVEQVIRGLHYFNSESDTFFPRTVLFLEEGAELSYVDEWIGEGRLNGKAPFASALCTVYLCAGAHLRYSQVQNWGSSVKSMIRQGFLIEKEARLENTAFSLGGLKTQVRTESECLGRGAQLSLKGAVRGDDQQLFDFWVSSHHGVSDSQSEMRYWNVMADEARSVFNGRIVITPSGTRTNAIQQNRNMLLSRKAVIDTLPKLEIATDDVKCAHGATVSPIHPDQLFYLQSRGVSLEEAEKMIIDGFTEPVLSLLPLEDVRNRVRDALSRKHRLEPELREEKR